MDLSAMEGVLIAAAGLCLLFLMGACYRWCKLVKRVGTSRRDMVMARRTNIAVIGSTPPQLRRPADSSYSEELAVRHENPYASAYNVTHPPPQQLPPYSARPPPYEPPPVFPDEPPPSYASISREERRQQRRIRIAATRIETRRINPSANA
ncbi:uncharacterized protein LOC110835776 [Zootermopsis nevadensis]|uniref:Uncharacterized protein n=1 Tax=Zootermopsis nevadensis TaxID=136037 RepID=A0A067QSU6_ZOONE|nr:uncharacterized protein LOC110835776 [Zootermopsis nevadensis]XP_021932030.1 uncharacterized protein LOC110835776 [Zootermopsis nevadensis]KDR12940.1 hypothetical protein L798_12897 [Zootermopsis nevadensis]